MSQTSQKKPFVWNALFGFSFSFWFNQKSLNISFSLLNDSKKHKTFNSTLGLDSMVKILHTWYILGRKSQYPPPAYWDQGWRRRRGQILSPPLFKHIIIIRSDPLEGALQTVNTIKSKYSLAIAGFNFKVRSRKLCLARQDSENIQLNIKHNGWMDYILWNYRCWFFVFHVETVHGKNGQTKAASPQPKPHSNNVCPIQFSFDGGISS